MKRFALRKIALISAVLIAAPAFAAAPAGAPSGSTGMCKDGSYYSGATKKGACHGHKGVKDWWGADSSSGTAAAPSGPASPAPAAAASAPPAAAAAAPARMPAPAAQAAPGGGAGQVWANSSSKVYHCSTDKWYGKTKNGSYMSEAEAKAKGYHADHGKACQ